ncbi:purine/pyrimidine permease [Saccharopolyspora erythraea]|uniref:uracil-xanthine permease family protein n=1 Tax=Saccharopolyspora erythraea TaxID=1836 RepID=UPI001BAE32DE|nr:solute carrier family 23 protein [Saccharopolyspora erythraea]QUH00003.1 purine/pyrimidine permease [Saccharopolyspora erythraea]
MPATHPVDEFRPLSRLIPFGLQHVLVMAASPISSVFLVSKTLGLDPDLTVRLLSATFVLSGVGTLVQSLGPWKFGARLPFVMLPGGAPVVLFIAIAEEHGLPTASGAVILTGLCYFVALPLFARLLRFFPSIVIGTMIVIIGVTLVKAGGVLVVGKPGTPGFGDPRNLLLGFATVAFTVLCFRFLGGVLRQLAVVFGLLAGTALAALLGAVHVEGLDRTAVVSLPSPLPFGPPEFDLVAALPLMIFALASMAEATGQTVLNGEIVGKEIDVRRDVPRTIRGDALVSLLGGLFGTSLMVTSGENVGIVRVTGVRSRFVTVIAGVLLVLIGVFTPIAHLVNAVPPAVVGGTAIVVFAIIAVLGVQMLAKADFADHANVVIVAVALSAGLLPSLLSGLYQALPSNLAMLLESGVAVGAFVAAGLNLLFHHLPRFGAATEKRENDRAAT